MLRKLVSLLSLQCFLVWICSTSLREEDYVIRKRHHKLYLFFHNGGEWNENRKKCLKISGDLVSMETEDEWRFITNELQNLTSRFEDEWHVGLQRHGAMYSNSWFWLTGVRLHYDRWQPFQPSGDGRCANIARQYMETTGGLNDLACRGWYSPRGYICELDTHRDHTDDGPVYTEKWIRIEERFIHNMTSNKNFPDHPDETYHLESFHITKGIDGDYGTRMRSYFLAPMTGNYSFYTACDDACQLFLSPGINPKDEKMIVRQDLSVSSNVEFKDEYKSKPQFLEEGKLYYMKVLFKQGIGNDFLDIAIELPGGQMDTPMSPDHLRRNISEIDLPGKDCAKTGDLRYPDYENCTEFTQKDKLDGVKSVLKMLQSRIANISKQNSTKILKYTMKEAARKITFLLNEEGAAESSAGSDDEGFKVSREVEQLAEIVAEKIPNKDEAIVMEYPSIVIQIKKLDDEFVFPNKSREIPFRTNDEISIKKLQSDSENYLVFSSLYKNLGDILQRNITDIDGDKQSRCFLNSRIITSSLIPRPKNMEKDSIRIKLEHNRYKTSKEQTMLCAFWKYNTSSENSTGSWSSVGCRLNQNESSENFTVCHCDHLTHFAVLMKVTEDKEKPLSGSHVTALEAITYVGCSLSLIGEVLTVLTLTCLRLARTETNMIHLNLVVALGLAQIIFLSGIGATANKGVCKFVAIALHFFNLVAFCWMLVEGLWLYVMVVRVFDTGYNRIRRYVIAAWSLPGVIVIVTLVSSFDGYGTKNSCWLSVEKGTIWSFVVPVLVIILVNVIILALVVREILKLHNPAPADESKLQCVRSGVKSAIVLLPILGIAWVFGILAVNGETVVFQYLFAIFNSIQGFMIFIFHCVLNSEVRKAFRRKKQIWSDSHLFQCHSVSPPPKYESDMSKETRSTSNGVDKARW